LVDSLLGKSLPSRGVPEQSEGEGCWIWVIGLFVYSKFVDLRSSIDIPLEPMNTEQGDASTHAVEKTSRPAHPFV